MLVDCIEYTGCKNAKGYGKRRHLGRVVLAHRLAYAQANSLDVFNMGGVVQHSCDNPSCVNSAHLSLGTNQTNTADMVEKGRQYRKFTDQQIAEIRAKYEPPVPGTRFGTTGNIAALCKEYGVSRMQVSLLVRNMKRVAK